MERTVAKLASESPGFRTAVNAFAAKVKTKAAAQHGNAVARGISVVHIPSDTYGRYDLFVQLRLIDSKGRNYTGAFEFGHAYNFWRPGEVPDHGYAARRWIPGSHFMNKMTRKG